MAPRSQPLTQRWRSELLPFTLVCPVYKQRYTPDPSDYVYNTNSTYVWCLCCLAHGDRKLHLVSESWNKDEPAAVQTAGT